MRELLSELPSDAVEQINAKIPLDKKTGKPKYPKNEALDSTATFQQLLAEGRQPRRVHSCWGWCFVSDLRTLYLECRLCACTVSGIFIREGGKVAGRDTPHPFIACGGPFFFACGGPGPGRGSVIAYPRIWID